MASRWRAIRLSSAPSGWWLLAFSAKGAAIMAGNPAVMRFMGRDAGMLVLIKLVQMSATGAQRPLLHRSRHPVRRIADPCARRSWKTPRNTVTSAFPAAVDTWSN